MKGSAKRPTLAVTLLLSALVAGLAATGCGETSPRSSPGGSFVIAMPVAKGGPAGELGQEMYRGARTRLAMLGGSIGGVDVELRRLDQEQGDGWPDPEAVTRMAAGAVAGNRTVAWLGGVDSNTTALALPVLNASGVSVVSPSAAATPFTLRDPAFPGAPAKYFPQAELYGRSFARISVADGRLAELAAERLAVRGVRSIYAVDAGDTDGVAFTSAIRQAAPRAGIVFAGHDTVVRGEANWAAVLRRAVEAGADAIAWGSAPGGGAESLWAAIAASGRGFAMIAGPAMVPGELAVLPETRGGTTWLSGLAEVAPSAAGDAFTEAFRDRYGREPELGAGSAAAAVDLLLDAIREGAATAGPRPNGDDLRGSVSRALHAVRSVETPLGRISMDGRGDRIDAPVVVWSVRSGELRPIEVLR